MTRKCKYTLMA